MLSHLEILQAESPAIGRSHLKYILKLMDLCTFMLSRLEILQAESPAIGRSY